jgi:hypothetical protein
MFICPRSEGDVHIVDPKGISPNRLKGKGYGVSDPAMEKSKGYSSQA